MKYDEEHWSPEVVRKWIDMGDVRMAQFIARSIHGRGDHWND